MSRNVWFFLFFLYFFESCGDHIGPNSGENGRDLQNLKTEIKENKVAHIVKTIPDLYEMAKRYTPQSIDIADDISFSIDTFNLIHDESFDSVMLANVGKIFLLKLYTYHLSSANQGYDVLRMMKRNETVGFVFGSYFSLSGVSLEHDCITTSRVAYWEANKSQNDTLVVALLEKVKSEEQRIKKMVDAYEE